MAQCAGIIGSFFTAPSISTWYATLAKPEWNPPSWIFGPVWTLLYTLIGVAAYLVWNKRKIDGRVNFALGVYVAHLVLNACWSVIFFGMQNPKLAFFEILILDIFIIGTLVLFYRIHKMAGLLLIPYLFWAFFATYLTYTIWMLN